MNGPELVEAFVEALPAAAARWCGAAAPAIECEAGAARTGAVAVVQLEFGAARAALAAARALAIEVARAGTARAHDLGGPSAAALELALGAGWECAATRWKSHAFPRSKKGTAGRRRPCLGTRAASPGLHSAAMSFTPVERNHLLAFTQSHWGTPHCKLCGQNTWAIDGPVELTMGHTPGSFEAVVGTAKQTMPCAAFTCRYCGNTIFVNLLVAGLVQQPMGWVKP